MAKQSRKSQQQPGASNGARKPSADDAPGTGETGETGDTYTDLRDDDRVVMRHQIALNIDNFKASTENFSARPARDYQPLRSLDAPFASVVIPNYNGRHLLPTVLAALGRQTFTDFETIVIDDASTDDSVSWIEKTHPDVRLIVNRRNLGFVSSCNIAADAADGRILVLLNSDTEPEPTWLEALARAVCEHPRAAIVTSKILLADDRQRLHTTGDTLGTDGIPRNRGVWEEDHGQYDADLSVFSGCGGATAYRREVWQALGGFDEDFWMYIEDVDLAFRARLMGWDAIYAPAARVFHQISASGGDSLSSFYVGRNTIWMLAKNMPRHLLRQHGREMLRAQWQIARDALRHIRGEAARRRLLGQFAALLGLARQLQKRRRIQTLKQVGAEQIRRQLTGQG